jgi:hypothetical protein
VPLRVVGSYVCDNYRSLPSAGATAPWPRSWVLSEGGL